MNILLVAHERNLGGATKSLATLAKELQENGNSVIVVVPLKAGQAYAELVKLQIPVFRIFFGWWMIPSYWNPFLKLAFRLLHLMEVLPAARIARLARRKDIQVIHSNSSVIDIGAIAAGMAQIPHIWHFREFGDVDYRLEYLEGMEKSYRFISKVGGQIVFISKSLREHYKNNISDDMCTVIYNGISNEFLYEKTYKTKYQKVIFLISGNFHRNKGQSIALCAAKILKDKGFENFELWVAGQIAATSDSHKYEKELRMYAKEHLEGVCRFLGYISDMKELRKKTDVELVCSKGEAFGRVTIEAMMAGNPVIGSDAGATPELITDKENGRLFHNGDVGDLAKKMQWFVENTERIGNCGENAYIFARDNFQASKNTKNIESLYHKVIGADTLSGEGNKRENKNSNKRVVVKTDMWNN